MSQTPEPPNTGDAVIDEALARAAQLDQLDAAERIVRLEQALGVLREALDRPQADPGGGPVDPTR